MDPHADARFVNMKNYRGKVSLSMTVTMETDMPTGPSFNGATSVTQPTALARAEKDSHMPPTASAVKQFITPETIRKFASRKADTVYNLAARTSSPVGAGIKPIRRRKRN